MRHALRGIYLNRTRRRTGPQRREVIVDLRHRAAAAGGLCVRPRMQRDAAGIESLAFGGRRGTVLPARLHMLLGCGPITSSAEESSR